MEEVFRVFHRIHGTGAYPGSGIGLAICRKIVARHRGRMWVESDVGRGSTFQFTLLDGAGPIAHGNLIRAWDRTP